MISSPQTKDGAGAATAAPRRSAGLWNEFDATALGEEVAYLVTNMIKDRDLVIEELERELALASAEIDRLRTANRRLRPLVEREW